MLKVNMQFLNSVFSPGSRTLLNMDLLLFVNYNVTELYGREFDW